MWTGSYARQAASIWALLPESFLHPHDPEASSFMHVHRDYEPKVEKQEYMDSYISTIHWFCNAGKGRK